MSRSDRGSLEEFMTEQRHAQPAILFSHFDGSGEFVAMAKKLAGQGYPVVAACRKGDTDAARSALLAGCVTVEAAADGGLRAGLEYFRSQLEALPGVVVFEPEDGFTVDDALRVAEAFESSPGKLVVASRSRNLALGLFTNLVRWLAALAFTLVHGRKVGDPWASLKALPSRFVPGFLGLKGDGCRLHLNILLNLQHMGVKTVSVPVPTAYEYECGSRLLDRAFDIFKILLLPLKFVSVSLVSTGMDYGLYGLFGYILLPGQWQIATIIGRSAGAVTGYILNRNVVFKRKNKSWRDELKPLLKFALLATINCLIALVVMDYIIETFNLYVWLTKVIADVALFITSFLIQRDFIFRKKPIA